MHVSFILSLLYSCAVVKIWSGKSNSYVFSHWRISISRTHADACALSIGSEAMKSSDQDGELTKLESILFIPNVGYKQKKSIFWTCVKKILLPSEDIRCMPNFEFVRKLFINWVELSQRVDVLPTISAASSVFFWLTQRISLRMRDCLTIWVGLLCYKGGRLWLYAFISSFVLNLVETFVDRWVFRKRGSVSVSREGVVGGGGGITW